MNKLIRIYKEAVWLIKYLCKLRKTMRDIVVKQEALKKRIANLELEVEELSR